ncbi:hypothetical protein [Streptomyces sp. NPDC093589]|uniref:hypothetical protein n=1 Tax=Streptomyces sp. NPDC093589 TaxID=3366043 RepID=UPI0038119A0D
MQSDLNHLPGELADRHAPHPQRRACSGDIPAHEREASAVCACPPPSTPPVPAVPLPSTTGHRR